MLPIRPGHEAEFEIAFARARPLIEAATGCRSVYFSRGIEHPSSFLLLVEWDSVDDHLRGFCQSPAFGELTALLTDFYADMPVVQHFSTGEGGGSVPQTAPRDVHE